MIGKWNVGVSLVAIAVAIGGGDNVAQAQDASQNAQSDSSPTVLEPIVVSGNRIPQQISRTARTIYVVDAQAIEAEARSGKTLQQILAEKVPSFDPASEGARTAYGQNLRGRTALILIDGVSMNSARSLSRQFDSIDPFNIERVEVLSGATAIYGGNATGGVINIITKKGKDAPEGLHGEVTAGLGSGFGHTRDINRNGAGAVTYNSENWDARFSIAGNQTGAFYDGSGTMLTPDITQTSTAFNKRVDFMGTVGLQIDDDRRLEVSGQFYDSAQDSPFGLYLGAGLAGIRNSNLVETRDGYRSDFDPRTRRTMVNATYTDNDFLGQELLLQGSFRREEIRFHPFPGSAIFSPFVYFGGSSQDTDYYSLKAAMISEPLDGLKVTYGIDADRDSLSSKQNVFDFLTVATSGAMDLKTRGITGLYPDIDVSTVAGFIQGSYEATDRLTVNGGVRYQYVTTDVSSFAGAAQQVAILNRVGSSVDTIPGGDVSYDAALFNAGVTYELADTQQVYANFSQGFELPDPAKYYGIGSYRLVGGRYVLLNSVNVADSALDAIKTNSFEVGYRFNDDTYSFETAAYYSLSDRSIELNRTTLAVDVVDRERRVYGIEASASVKLDYGFDVGTSAHWVKSEIKADGSWEKESIGTASVSKLGGYVGWTKDNFNVKLAGQHVFSLSDDDSRKIDDYTLFDLTGAYRFEAQDTTLRFGVMNLFDTDYTTIWGARANALYGALANEAVFDYKGRGRTFAVSLTKVF
ncbi:TonB-dependent receptor [Rhizobium nepotum]|uniref:Rhizobactin receptor n=1 Tax=Rhizobium nepotum 39/7 TaxID=1368418 RepID=A0ABR5CMK6_9HYPH|nr:TonB-dependent receptor [Rhizobium nepotum]KJF66088.1 Rhizobactin receptor [Rhizobium nepotum 39/7]